MSSACRSSRRRSAPGTPRLTTSVDHLLLPRVVGATVEGPKTPRRSKTTNNLPGFYPNASSNGNGIVHANINNNYSNHMPTVSPYLLESPNRHLHRGEEASRYVDDKHSYEGGREAYNSNLFETPRGAESYLDAQDDDDDVDSLEGFDEDDMGHDATKAPPSPHSDDRLSKSHYPSLHGYPEGHADYESDGSENGSLDVGTQEYHGHPDERLRGNVYEDPDIDDDDATEVYVDEEARAKQMEWEAEERKRERKQLGFIKQLTNFLRKQRDDYGWGTPQKQQNTDFLEEEEDLSESDFDRVLSSARARRGSPRAQLRSIKSRLNEASVAPALNRTVTPPTLRRTATPPVLHRTPTPLSLHRPSTPPALHRNTTPPALHRTTTPPALHRPTTPPALRRTATPPVLLRTKTPPTLHRTATPTLRRTLSPQVVHSTTAPSSVANWINAQSWVHAGVASGLLSPGTLIGVAVLCFAVGGRYILGYDGSSDVQWKDGNCENATVAVRNPNQNVFFKGIISNTWDKLGWGSSANNSQYRGDGSRSAGWLTKWIPQLPTMSHWIPSGTGSKKSKKDTNKIQIPTADIQSLEELESRIEWIQKVLVDLGHADEELSKELQIKMDGMSVWISGVEHKLNRVSNEVHSLREYVKDGRWIEQTVLELIRDEIPRHLVVSRDPKTGKLSIPGDFWETARGLFLTPEQMETSIKEKFEKLGLDPEEQDEVLQPGGWGWGSSKTKGSKNGKGIVSWDDFLRENERAMSDFVEGRMSKVSRSVFLSLVRTEANAIWQGLERNVMALLEKQGKLQGRTAPGRSGYKSNNNVAGRELTEVEQDLILGLIDEALEKYSADAMAKPDYALFSAGGRIIPRLTSPSYHHVVNPTFWGRIGLQYIVPSPRREKSADKAIQPDMHSGECWAMDGQDGQLGIRLARRIIVSEVTIEHADPSVVLDMNSAPREVEIWGLRGDEDRAPRSEQPAHSESTSQTGPGSSEQEAKEEQSKPVDSNAKPNTWWREGIPWHGATLLTTVQYDASADKKTRQTFSIPLSKQTVPSMGVALRFKSNWGHPNYTCVYRVRVHGYEPTE
ncbi:hypothetical protein BGZ58_000195 [Dissophora ornata]|nr:hypothetical protein BGZ58_000195 [Dissophora ornata]